MDYTEINDGSTLCHPPHFQEINAKHESDQYDFLLHEGISMLQLEHPNIVKLIDIKIAPPKGYLIMEFCLMTLHFFWSLEEGRRLNEMGHLVILGSLAKGLAFIHKKGCIHRDMKETNVLSEF